MPFVLFDFLLPNSHRPNATSVTNAQGCSPTKQNVAISTKASNRTLFRCIMNNTITAVVLFTGILSRGRNGENAPMAYFLWRFLNAVSIWGCFSMRGRNRPYFSSRSRSNLAALAWTFHALDGAQKWSEVSSRRVTNSSTSFWAENRRSGPELESLLKLEGGNGGPSEEGITLPSRSNSASSPFPSSLSPSWFSACSWSDKARSA
mmetsp:Transcript_50899/g.108432  ORF Transcript_50899/g.108432 Transcript_50899/m.108432 type:complete len:205 (+) Transcript_50899:557-1171(+)